MHAVLKLAEDVIAQRIAQHPIAGHYNAGMVFMIFSGIMLCIGVGFLLYATYLWALTVYSQYEAAALTGVLALVFSFVTAMGLAMYKRYQTLKMEKAKVEMTKTILELLEVVQKEFSEPVRTNPKTAVAAASVAGHTSGKHFVQGTE